MSINLKWGQPHVVPGGARAAWGSRWIVQQNGYTDIVWDRQDMGGADTTELLDVLNAGLLAEVRATISDLLSTYDMETSVHEDFIVHDDGTVTVHANTNASHGYCYVTAWLNGE